ncbi:MAG: acetoin utilization protein AcuC [Thermoplasmata archaeon]|nr:acetoin utilization protein AcuC [Thermoplasmata archaeon]
MTEARIVWDPRFLAYDFGPQHPFTERSRGLAVELLRRLSEGASVSWEEQVDPLSREELERFHRREYIDLVERLSARGQGEPLDAGDTPSFPGCHEAAARMAGGTVAAARWAMGGAGRRAFQPGGGLHHAHPDRASGFCIYNDLALAIRYALDGPLHLARVAYLDIDAHHGDGVMYGFYDDGRLLDIDFHQDGRTIFPGTGAVGETGRGDGAGLKVNVPLPPGAGDEAFLPIFHRVVPELLRSYRPQLLVLQHGVDSHAGDALAGLQYTHRAYAEALRVVLELAHELGETPVLVTGGGGYTPENVTRTLARAGLRLFGCPPPSLDHPLPEGWRSEFRLQFGQEAPADFGDLAPVYRSPWTEHRTEKLIEELEEAMGRTFRAPRGAG